MSRADDLDRTQELPPEPLDDLAPLQSTDSTPVPRPERIQTISLPLPLDELSSDDVEHDRMIARELASRRMSIARREQRHRHSIERAEQRHRHEQRLLFNGEPDARSRQALGRAMDSVRSKHGWESLRWASGFDGEP